MPKEQFISIHADTTISSPAADVYERWCHLEEYPSFMEGVREIRWLDERRFNLSSESAGHYYESICEISLKIPNSRMAWRTISGPDSSGAVTFEALGPSETKVTLKILYNPDGGWDPEQTAQRLSGNLERFKSLMEQSSTVDAA